MKKLFAIVLALCLLASCALADGPEAELNWADYDTEENQSLGQTQVLTIPDICSLYFWVPTSVMNTVDVSSLGGAAGYQTDDGVYSLFVSVLNVTSLEDYLTQQQANGTDNFHYVTTNGIDCVSGENEANGVDLLVIPVTETMVAVFAFTPLHGDETWDHYKAVMVASIRVAE